MYPVMDQRPTPIPENNKNYKSVISNYTRMSNPCPKYNLHDAKATSASE